jgi:hypothetical protein
VSGRAPVVLCLLAICAPQGCSKGTSGASPAPTGVGQELGDIGHDLPIIRSAEGAANEVVRAAGDCDAVKAALPRAQAALDEALPLARTGTSRMTLANLRKQITDIAGACP